MIDVNEIKEGKEGLETKEWFQEAYEKSIVDLSKKPLKPKPVITIGERKSGTQTFRNEVMTKGEISLISAPSKSFKTYLKSHFASAYLKNHYDEQLSDIRGHREENECLVDIDTEQGEFWGWNTFNRTKILSGIDVKDIYFPFRLRNLDCENRLKFIEKLLYSGNLKKKPSLVFIDGIADLLEDENDLKESKRVINKLMKWSDELNIHISGIIHNAFGSLKPTGHLGSVSVKKMESVFNLIPETQKDMQGNEETTGIVVAKHSYSRGSSFSNFKFKKHETEDRLELVHAGEEYNDNF